MLHETTARTDEESQTGTNLYVDVGSHAKRNAMRVLRRGVHAGAYNILGF
jgi:hypothetical protein